ncbi:uncharacterized protein LOC124181277 [Neodiprion fabricii]|uniref:uncharacterized protein LOC124181277 n=1 Tax=Neodiprion fabricii TaxID=2872261 RepID=UPI001ED90FB7|nr:uncharacterized protein LOC124181277 [Neodiprion fabricii]
MDLKYSISTAMQAIVNKSKVTLKGEHQLVVPDLSELSEEEAHFYNLMFGDDVAAVRHRKIHCTACDIHIGSAPASACNMYAHPVLRTLLCAACREFYGDGNFEQGEDATDMFCRWCANGGNLYCCSYCSNTICNKCIKRNFDPLMRIKIEGEEKWKCFVCDPTDVYTLRAICWALLQHIQTVTRILRNDKVMSTEELTEKMLLDEAKCCMRKRKAKRRRRTSDLEEDDETFYPELEEMSLSLRRRMHRKSPRFSSITNGEQVRPTINTRIPAKNPNETVDFDDDDVPLPMIPCVQSMVEGDSSSETLIDTLTPDPTIPELPSRGRCPPPPLQINPIPTANLLKPTLPPLSPIRNSYINRKRPRTLHPILPIPNTRIKMLMVENSSKPCPPASVHTIEYSSLPLRAPAIQPQVPMVTIPTTSKNYPLSTARILGKKPQSVSPGISNNEDDMDDKAETVIEIDSDSEDSTIGQANGNIVTRQNREFLKDKLIQKINNKVEAEMDLRTEEVKVLFKMIGWELTKIPLSGLAEPNKLRAMRTKTRRFHHAIAKAIDVLSNINDQVITKYDNWRKTMLEQSRQTRSCDNVVKGKRDEPEKDFTIPLDMICTNSESELDDIDEYESDDMHIPEKIKCIKSFRERDTVDVAIGDPVKKADKSVQVYDIVERDYEKCIGHSVLTKVEYDPVDRSEMLKPVIVPAEYDGKFEEQFIFYLQHREDNEISTEDEKGLPDPNETPLKDLIEANSPFVLEMLESIDSPLQNGMNNGESKTGASETSDESGKENKEQGKSTHLIKELAKLVTELSEDLKTSRNNDTLTKKHSEHGKKDRRKQNFDQVANEEEIDIAVQALIEEDERSRSSSKDDEVVSRHVTQLKTSTIVASEDECTIID